MRNDRRMDKRRENGGRRSNEGGFGLKGTLFVAGIILALGVIAFFVTIGIYNKNLEKVYDDLQTTEIGETILDNNQDVVVEEASSQIGKSAEEQINEVQETSTENEEIKEVSINEENIDKSENKNVASEENKKEENQNNQTEPEPVKDPEFITPVQGELMKEYAKDKLVYSETLKEWVVHTGVDIKAEKTTVVKAAEGGKVTAIKNDPRYGITVIIEHSNGFETRYANLLTAEFINVGEEVTKDQTIGTVGNTATFEVLDDYHLHFEILKNGEYQDPALFIEI